MAYDFEQLLAPIHESSLSDLLDLTTMVEVIVPELGLNDESRPYYAEHLQKYLGWGLKIWQWPIQFAPYLRYLSDKNIRSYCEIGVRHGGSFIATVEYLDRVRKLTDGGVVRGVAVDINNAPMLREYCEYNPSCSFMQADSRGEAARSFITTNGPYDLSMIDGDHEYAGAKADFELLRPLSRIVALNDTANDGWPGVIQLWDEVRDKVPFVEWTEFHAQDPVVEARFRRHGGFGVIVLGD